MKPDYFKNLQQLSHDDDRRYLLLMRGLRIMHEEKKQHNPLQKAKKKCHGIKTIIEAKGWGERQKKIDQINSF